MNCFTSQVGTGSRTDVLSGEPRMYRFKFSALTVWNSLMLQDTGGLSNDGGLAAEVDALTLLTLVSNALRKPSAVRPVDGDGHDWRSLHRTEFRVFHSFLGFL